MLCWLLLMLVCKFKCRTAIFFIFCLLVMLNTSINIFFNTEPLVGLIHFRREKEYEDFFPNIGNPTVRRIKKPVTEEFPTVVYTDHECLQIIKQCDKDTNASYVKDFNREVNEKLSQK